MADQELRIGKCSENVLDRSVYKIQGSTRVKDACFPVLQDGRGADENQNVYLSMDPATIGSVHTGKLAAHAAMNGLAAKGVFPEAITDTILLPQGTMESMLRQIIFEITQVCEEERVRIVGGHSEVTDAVTRPVVVITAAGCGKSAPEKASHRVRRLMQEGSEVLILMTKWAGLEGSYILAEEAGMCSEKLSDERLSGREETAMHKIPPALMMTLRSFGTMLSTTQEACIAAENGAAIMVNLSEGGVFGALWKLSAEAGCGFEVDLQRIPIRQETIELTNRLDINPYEIESAGALLFAAEKETAGAIMKALAKKQIPVTVIGKLTEGNKKCIHNEEEERCLDMPSADALVKWSAR